MENTLKLLKHFLTGELFEDELNLFKRVIGSKSFYV